MFCLGFLLTKFFIQKNNSAFVYRIPFYCLLLAIIGMAAENIAWIFRISLNLGFISIPVTAMRCITFTSWIFYTIRYQAIGFFIEGLTDKKLSFNWYQIVFAIGSAILSIMFIYTAYLQITNQEVATIGVSLIKTTVLFTSSMFLPSIYISIKKLRNPAIPVIIKKQLTIFLQYFLVPTIFLELLQVIPFFGPLGALANPHSLLEACSTILITVSIIFCSQKIVGFRFFNFTPAMLESSKGSFSTDLKDAIEHVSNVSNEHEIIYISQHFLSQSFNIPTSTIFLHFRHKKNDATFINSSISLHHHIIENFISQEHNIELLHSYKILIADEIAFDAYYEEKDSDKNKLLEFLQSINCSVFLPLFNNKTIVAYLYILHHHEHKFYNQNAQIKLTIFGNYLASAIHILKNNDLLNFAQEHKKIKEELYFKHKETEQIKETIANLIKQKAHFQIGIIFYKNGHFIFGNHTASELIAINPNQQKNHPLSIVLHKFAHAVDVFRAEQCQLVDGPSGNQLQLCGIPHLDRNAGIIITVHKPDAADIIKYQSHLLKDPSQRDYLLYLETTKSGQLINQLLPSNSETILNFKIQLLKIALTKKATLLDVHFDDLQNTVEIIHAISLREGLHTINLTPNQQKYNLCVQLFGINPLLQETKELPIFERFSSGTLCIKNIDLLDLETQDKLAHFIRYGLYTPVKSAQQKTSEIRIICTVSNDINLLVLNGQLSKKLYDELLTTSLHMPSMLLLDSFETEKLIDSLAQQSLQDSKQPTQTLSEKEKQQIITQQPASLAEMKTKIKYILSKKRPEETTQLVQAAHFDKEFESANPDLMRASRLGKHCLKDPKLMAVLWDTFKSQNKIAEFLQVNRSSVNRRCKEYNLFI